MARSQSVAYDGGGEDDFDPESQLAILRRAVAEIVLPGKVSPARLATTRTELRRYCSLAELVLESSGLDSLASEVSALDARLGRRVPNRALLALVRRELHGCLIRGSAALPATAAAGAGGALSMRALLSDFHGALLPETEDENVWALTVAAAELSLLLREPALALGPLPERNKLTELGARTERWSAGGGSRARASELYAEVTSSADLLETLSRRPDVRRHDERVLRELSQLLNRGVHDLTLAASAADRLAALRGLDLELDRLIVELPLDPVPTLARIAQRVRKLCLARLAS